MVGMTKAAAGCGVLHYSQARLCSFGIIPYLGVHLAELTAIYEGNSDYLQDAQHLYNIDKYRLIHQTINRVHDMQKSRYNFIPIRLIQVMINKAIIPFIKLSSTETSTFGKAMYSLSEEVESPTEIRLFEEELFELGKSKSGHLGLKGRDVNDMNKKGRPRSGSASLRYNRPSIQNNVDYGIGVELGDGRVKKLFPIGDSTGKDKSQRSDAYKRIMMQATRSKLIVKKNQRRSLSSEEDSDENSESASVDYSDKESEENSDEDARDYSEEDSEEDSQEYSQEDSQQSYQQSYSEGNSEEDSGEYSQEDSQQSSRERYSQEDSEEESLRDTYGSEDERESEVTRSTSSTIEKKKSSTSGRIMKKMRSYFL